MTTYHGYELLDAVNQDGCTPHVNVQRAFINRPAPAFVCATLKGCILIVTPDGSGWCGWHWIDRGG